MSFIFRWKIVHESGLLTFSPSLFVSLVVFSTVLVSGHHFFFHHKNLTEPFSHFCRTHFRFYPDRLNVFINFNKAIQVNVPHAITLKRFKCHITKMIAPCECPKIYFNGLQLQTDDQTLATYGILDGSSIYVNTENVIGKRCEQIDFDFERTGAVHTPNKQNSN